MSPPPLVSIVVATYNRSQVVAHAIASVRRSTVTDWELIVVGDHCTDDTEAVVAGFADPRITWVNLAENAGEQSGPNNEGIRRARGRYLAFLNHDDLYFPDHLATRSPAARRRGRPRVVAAAGRAARPEADLAEGREQFRLSGVTLGDDYDPRVFVFASSWLMRRELAERIGPWRSGRETFVTASQDWMFRAWRSGARLRFHAHVGVLAVPASCARGSYLLGAQPGARSLRRPHEPRPASAKPRSNGPRSPASARRTASGSASRRPPRSAAWCSGRPAPPPWPSARIPTRR